jgi:hypothetical protein
MAREDKARKQKNESKPPSPEGEGFERKKTVLQAKPRVARCLIAFDSTEVLA